MEALVGDIMAGVETFNMVKNDNSQYLDDVAKLLVAGWTVKYEGLLIYQ